MPVPCAWCRQSTAIGRPCTNPSCREPQCPGCGRKPWHDRAICKDVLRGDEVVIKGCGTVGKAVR